MKHFKKHWILLLGCFLLLTLLIWIPTIPAVFKTFDYSATGNIGDTIGGISSPIIGGIGAFLVYISFKQQLKANKIQIKALKKERNRYTKERFINFKNEQYLNCINDFKNLKLYYPKFDALTAVDEANNVHSWVNQLLNQDEIVIIENKRAIIFVSHKIIFSFQLSHLARYELENFSSNLLNVLISISNEINNLKEIQSHTNELNLLIDRYSIFLSNNVMPLLNPWMSDRAKDKEFGSVQSTTMVIILRRIKENWEIYNSFLNIS